MGFDQLCIRTMNLLINFQSGSIFLIYLFVMRKVHRRHPIFGRGNKVNKQREFMDSLGEQLGFQKMEDWYKVQRKDIVNKGGGVFLADYNDSPSRLLQS